ncbi:tetratricopeptide repeat protein [Actinomadura sp. 7K534]|uniref:AfsR/SARP family transcriptional regulator n=1 Tax=Actinomadura sp. 7K534 TaxID=2530366 RepID=UPI00104AE7F9|nr:tetratricopeptide repeat protein [Actinomadura sp. 7K534]TDB92858.1 tetratricopeptide repeat protein [Actinomadura sp. 7K534]
MEFRLLGPLELWSDGQRLHLGWAKERCVLAALLMTPGRPVTSEMLIDRVWGTEAPDRAKDLLYPHITRLRRNLAALGEEVRLERSSGAYVLDVDPATIDYHRFRTLCDQARAIAASGHPDEAVRLFGDALRLWRGEPLRGVTGEWAAWRRRDIQEELLGAALDRARLELDLGEHAKLVTELNELLDRFPGNEKTVELLMRALHRGGRSAEALRVYERARQRLAAELGASPNPGLRELHRQILSGEPGPAASPGRARAFPPSDLPGDLHTFTGREAELDRLAEMAGEGGGTAVTVLAVDGMPGVGKTTLAIRLAHRLAPRYPDGQMFLDLFAHDREREPLDPAAALGRLLRASGVDGDRIPADLDGRAALWRTELAGRRVLLVLDNALGHDQVRPLLPGSPGCLVLITSRRRLVGLDAARTLSLDVLAPDDAALLLTRSAGLAPDADPESVRTVARLCGRLPLAVQLIGNRLRHRTSWTVADLADRLGGLRSRLTEFRAGNRRVSAAFELSYLGLDERQRLAFRLLGLHPGADLTARDAAALLDTAPADAESLLDDLHDHHLIAEPRRGRYRYHDLIREYARHLVADLDPAPVREAAVDRLLDHYLAAAAHADRLLFPYRSRPDATAPAFFGDAGAARAWIREELDNVLRVARHAADHGRPRHAALLAAALGEHLESQGHWPEAADLHERAVRAWRDLGDGEGTARALADLSRLLLRAGWHEEALNAANEGLTISAAGPAVVAALHDLLGLIHWHRSEYDVAVGYYDRALELWRSAGDRAGEAEVLHHRAIISFHQGRYAEATKEMRIALARYEEVGHRRGRQMVLNNLGDIARKLGRYDLALRHYEEAGAVMEMSRQHLATWLNNIAAVRVKSGHADEGIENYRQALSIYRELGARRDEAACLNNIGLWYAEMNREGEALIHFQKSLQLSQEIPERFEMTAALRNIADVSRRAGRYQAALDHYEESLALARSIGDAYQEARALDGIAQVMVQIHGEAQAAPYRRQALDIYEELGVPEADEARLSPDDRDSAAGI